MNNSNSKPTEPTLHEQEWKDSAVSDAIIAANVWTITDSREVDKLLNRNVNQRWAHSADLVPGWAVAGVEPATGERTLKGAQYKPAKPQTDPQNRQNPEIFIARQNCPQSAISGNAGC
jgi:hypothetical protein